MTKKLLAQRRAAALYRGTSGFFFGRERDQRVIVSNILAVPLTILYGASGVGKSSVLFAGVVPHLKERSDSAVIVFQNWQQEGFADELKKACIAAASLSASAESYVSRSPWMISFTRQGKNPGEP